MGKMGLYVGEKVPSVQKLLSGSGSQNLRTDRWGQEELALIYLRIIWYGISRISDFLVADSQHGERGGRNE